MTEEREPSWSAWGAAIAAWSRALPARPELVAILVLELLLILFLFAHWGGPTLVVGTVAALVALGQLQVARRRHEEQTKADLQRRVIESFIKAVELLGSDQMQVRLGGIHTLERISRESKEDYWPVMETLTGFVRERARWKDDGHEALFQAGRIVQQEEAPQRPKLATDIAAVLAVLVRRDGKDREQTEKWRLDLSYTDLRGANLKDAHFESANLEGAHLERANLVSAHLEKADLTEAHLEGANLGGAHLEGADLMGAHLDDAHLKEAHFEGAFLGGAHLKDANLRRAHFERAILLGAHLEQAFLMEAHFEEAILLGAHCQKTFLERAHLKGAALSGAHFEGADLEAVNGLTQDQLNEALGDDETRIPKGMTRPKNWSKSD